MLGEFDGPNLKAAIKRLHTKKNRSYAGAWKRRGELVSILPNIARKVDRLEAVAGLDGAVDGEALLDTAVDLFVYASKYRLFLAEQAGADVSFLAVDAPRPYSDHDVNFDHLVDLATFSVPYAANGLQSDITDVTSLFERAWQAGEQRVEVRERQRLAFDLARCAERLVAHIAGADAPSLERLTRA